MLLPAQHDRPNLLLAALVEAALALNDQRGAKAAAAFLTAAGASFRLTVRVLAEPARWRPGQGAIQCRGDCKVGAQLSREALSPLPDALAGPPRIAALRWASYTNSLRERKSLSTFGSPLLRLPFLRRRTLPS